MITPAYIAAMREALKTLSARMPDLRTRKSVTGAELGYASITYRAYFEARFGAVPSAYAMQGFDTAMLIDSAVRKTFGDTKDRARLAQALRQADFTSLRGVFRFNRNGYPIQDFYQVRAIKRPDGRYQTEIVSRILSGEGDAYAKDCPLQ